MNKPDEPFFPEHVDEQVDELTQARDPSLSTGSRLAADLHTIYQEDEEIVELVWTRLATSTAQRREAGAQSGLLHMREQQPKGSQAMPSPFAQKPQHHHRIRWLEILAAVLLVGVVVGSMAFLLQNRHSFQAHGGTATPTGIPSASPTPASNGQGGLYVTTLDGIDRINPSTGKVIWHTGSGVTGNLLVEQGIVIFSGGNTADPGNVSNYYVEAVHATSGTQIWRKSFGPVYDLQGTSGMVAVSSCSPPGSCAIDALKTSNGEQVWSYPSSQGMIWELSQDGIIYGISYADFFALHASTGVPLWQQTLQHYPYQAATMTPFVSGGELYFASCDSTKQTSSYGACDFFAFHATTGEELWHKPFPIPLAAIPTVVDGVVYVASYQGIIDAFNASTGALLWSYYAGGTILNPLLSNQGVLFAEVQATGTTTRLLALKVTRTAHAVAWSQNLNLTGNKPDTNPLVLENGLIEILEPNNTILAFQAESGDRAPGYRPHVTAGIVSFSFVS